MAAAGDPSSSNPLDQVVSQYKKGYRTSEFWVAIAAGTAQAVVIAFDPSKPVRGQITNLTWIALAYILSRSGLKVARAATQAKTITALAAAQGVQALTADAAATTTQSAPASMGPFPSYQAQSTPTVEGNGVAEWMMLLRNLVYLRDSGQITPNEFARRRAELPQ